MKKKLLVVMICGASLSTNAQVVMENIVPPFGSTLNLYTISGSITDASGGANQTWDYSAITIGSSPIVVYDVVDPKTLSKVLADSAGTANFVNFMEGSPDPAKAACDFYTNKTTCYVKTAKHSSGGSPVQRANDTTMLFTQTYGTTVFYNHMQRKYDGYGTLKVGTDTYTNVIKMKSYFTTANSDTLIEFHQFKPYYQELFSYIKKNNGGGYQGGYYYKYGTTTTGIATSSIQTSTLLYPNPNNGSFTLTLPQNNTLSNVQIINTLGETVYNKTVSGMSNVIDISNAADGLYMVKTTIGAQVSTQRFIKQ